MAPSSSSGLSLSSGGRSSELKIDPVEVVMDLIDDYEDSKMTMHELYRGLKEKDQGTLSKCILALCNRSNDSDEKNMINIELCDALRRKNENIKCSIVRLKSRIAYWKSCALNSCNSCDALTKKNDDLNSSLNCLQSENELLKSNASMPCKSCFILNDDLDKARDDIALLKSNASLPCGS